MTETSRYEPFLVDADRVLASGITPARCCVWAIEKQRDGQPEQALRLLKAAEALIRQSAYRTAKFAAVLGA